MNAVVLAQGNPFRKNPYLAKLSLVLDKADVPHEFWIWRRDKASIEDRRVRVLLDFGSWGGGFINFIGYFCWVVMLALRVFSNTRETVYFCSRIDSALPCAFVAIFRRCNFVFLDRDTLSKSYPWPGLIRTLIESLESFVSGRALLHIVPGESRVKNRRLHANLRIVPNTPHSDLIAAARQIPAADRTPNNKLRVLVSGLVSPERGAAMILRAIEEADPEKVEFYCVGRLIGDDARQIAARLGSNYRGQVSNEEALALTIHADVVLAFYDPRLEINRLAEPNKWFDCAALGIPFVTNPGIETATPFGKAGGCFFCHFGNGIELAALLERLCQDRTLLKNASDGLQRLRFEPWNLAMGDVIESIKHDRLVA
jgi:hypothetical protein